MAEQTLTPPPGYESYVSAAPPTPSKKLTPPPGYEHYAEVGSAPDVALQPYSDKVSVGLRGQRPYKPIAAASYRGAPPPKRGAPMPAVPEAEHGWDASALDPYIEAIGSVMPKKGASGGLRGPLSVSETIKSKVHQYLDAPAPITDALADTARGVTTPKNIALVAGIAAANLTPAGPAVDIAAAGYFGKKMLKGAYDADAERQKAQREAAVARAQGDEEKAKYLDNRADYYRAHTIIAVAGAVAPAYGLTREGVKMATEVALERHGSTIGPDRLEAIKQLARDRTQASESARRQKELLDRNQRDTDQMVQDRADQRSDARLDQTAREQSARDVAEVAPQPPRGYESYVPVAAPPDRAAEAAAALRLTSQVQAAKDRGVPPVEPVDPVAASPEVTVDADKTLAEVDKLRENPIREKDPTIVRNSEFANYERQIRQFAEVHHPDLIPELDEALAAHDNGDVGDALVKLEIVAQKFHERAKEMSRRQLEEMRRGDQEVAHPEEGPSPEQEGAPLENVPEGYRAVDPSLFADLTAHTQTEHMIQSHATTLMEQFRQDFNPNKKTLIEFVREKGGVRDEGGDLASQEVNSRRGRGVGRGDNFKGKILNNKTGLPADTMREYAVEAGYLPEDSTAPDLFSLINDELDGKPHYSTKDEGLALGETQLKDLGMTANQIAKELKAPKGKGFKAILQAFEDHVREHFGDQIKSDVEVDLGKSAEVTLGRDQEEAQQKAREFNQQRMAQSEDFRNQQTSKIFDTQSLVDSPLFQGRGGAQGFLGTDDRAVFGDAAEPEGDVDLSFDFGDKVDSFVDTQKAAINDLLGRQTHDVIPLTAELFARVAAIGAAKLAKGVHSFGKWSAEMVGELGEQIRPYLRQIWTEALKRAETARDFNVEDYFNFSKFSADLSEGEKQNLRNEMIATVLQTGEIPKGTESWESIEAQARKDYGSDILPFLKERLAGGEQERVGLRIVKHRIDALNSEIVRLEEQAIKIESAFPEKAQELRDKAAALEPDLRELTSLSISGGLRSEAGRTLAIYRQMTKASWDLSFWLERAKKNAAITKGEELPPEISKEIRGIVGKGQQAIKDIRETAKGIATRGGKRVAAEARDDTPVRDFPELTGPIETLYGTQELKLGEKPKNLGELRGAIQTIRGQIEELTSGPARPELPELTGRITTLRGAIQEIESVLDRQPAAEVPSSSAGPVSTLYGTQETKLGEAPKTLPELKGRIETLRGQLAELEALVVSDVSLKDLPELKGAISTLRGRIQELEGVLSGAEPKDLPELKGPIKTVVGIQNDLRAIRSDMAKWTAEQHRMARTQGKLRKSGSWETVSAVRRAGLMGAFTTARNLGGNLAFAGLEEGARLPAVLVDMARQLYGTVLGQKPQRAQQGPSVRAIWRGIVDAGTKGMSEAAEIMKHGATVQDLARTEQTRELNSGVPWLDKLVNTQFRFMAAQDRLFKSYHYRRALEEQMFLDRKNGGDGSPTQSMIANAIAYADYATFNNRNFAAKQLRDAQARMRATGTVTGNAASFAIDTLIPYANTPANVFMRQMDYSPVGLIGRTMVYDSGGGGWVPILKAMRGKLNPSEIKTFQLAVGRGLVGTAMIYAGYKLAEKGQATGLYDMQEGSRNVMELAGRQPGSVLLGKRWIGVGQLAPAGSLIAAGAEMYKQGIRPLHDESKRPAHYGSILGRAVLDQPMISGVKSAIDTIGDDSGNRLGKFISTTVGSFSPTYLSEASQVLDPYMRDARPETVADTIYKGVLARTPGRFSLAEKRDVLGRTRQQPTIGAPALELSDSIANELVRNNVSIGFSQRKPDETTTAFQLRTQFVGRLIDEHIGKVLQRPGYPSADVDKRKKWIEDAVTEARQSAASTLDRKFKTEDARESFLNAQIQRVELRLRNRPVPAMVQPAPKPLPKP